MCGIAGYIGTRDLSPHAIEGCLALMRRRGPDGQAARQWVNRAGRHVHLLFSRLSIIDLDERAGQPMARGTDWIVFNGELYNYVERRAELEREGARFSTSSDTEVMLAWLGARGLDGLDACEGMWAFALYREQTGTLTLCRDRFGEKPLYLYRDATGVYFGSEVKFVFALLGRRLPVNADHLRRFMVNGYKALYKGRHTFFAGLEELGPGELLELDPEGRGEARRYWQPRAAVEPDMEYADAVAGARDRLVRSVELRLRADVPLAFCMSGGVDSNALISIAKRVFGYDVHGFTIVNSDARYEEQDMVECAVRELDVRHTALPVTTRDFLPRLRELVRYHDAPVYTITYYAQWMLQEAIAAAGYRISVSGTAADELFTGYYDHHLAYLCEVDGDAALRGPARAAWTEHIRPIVRNPYLRDPDLFVRDPAFRDHVFLGADGFAGYLTAPWGEAFEERNYSPHLLRNRMLNELFHEATPAILHEDDLNAMYHSVENRSPFLDRSLFEFCNSIPTRHLIRDGRAKAVLRDALAGIGPDAVMRNRRKVGFNAPIYDFLDVADPAVREELLRDSPVFELIRRGAVEDLLAKPDLPNSESKFLFYFLNCKMFLEEFA
ncbi:MAG: asparagine synthase (glutamine-hydrolyzing) [Burkholderiales bacterium]